MTFMDVELPAQRHGEHRWRDILDAHAEPICRYLPDTTLTFVNAAFCAAFERRAAELLGRRLIDLVPDAHRTAVLDHVRAVLADGEATRVRQVEGADGAIAHEEWVDRAIFDSNGRVVELQGARRDVTRLVRFETELATQRASVTHLSRIGMLGQLSGAFAHELRQPLTAILSNAQTAQRLVRQQPVDIEEVEEILADIVADDVRMGKVIGRLGALLKRRDLDLEPLRIDATVRDALDLARAKLTESSVAVKTRFAAGLPEVRGDRVQLEQVVLNLLLNAIDALSANDPSDREVCVTVGPLDARTIQVIVGDNGAGISRAAAERLFEPFNSTKPDGLGLGLSICRAIIEAHNGSVSARAGEPRGAEFLFTLPVLERSDTARETLR